MRRGGRERRSEAVRGGGAVEEKRATMEGSEVKTGYNWGKMAYLLILSRKQLCVILSEQRRTSLDDFQMNLGLLLYPRKARNFRQYRRGQTVRIANLFCPPHFEPFHIM